MTPPPFSLTLRQLADFAEIRGASVEATDWRRLADDLDRIGADEIARLTVLARKNRLSELTTVHPTLQSKLRELLLDGPAIAVGTAWTGLPYLLRRLLEFAAVDSTGAAALARAGVVTLVDLGAALEEKRLNEQSGVGIERVQMAASTLQFERPRFTLGRASELIDTLTLLIATACPDLQSVTAAADVRRFEPLVDSLVIVASASDPPAILDEIASISTLRVLHRTGRRAVVAYQQAEVDIRVSAPDEFGSALYVATGSRAHLTAMRGRQQSVRIAARESDVYSHAGLDWIAPELRHDTGEIEAAARGQLPDLVAREHMRGDLHMHSTYSDGRDSVAEMVQVSATLQYEYIAITDHSERAGAPKTVTRDALVRQREEIERLRERYPSMTILHGIEVDIMPDGRLDFPDDVLESLDIVLASLHDSAGHDGTRLTRRCLAAIENPFVNIITHPINRLVGRDEGYELDFVAIYEAAAATGTALEIDGAPSHLDLDGEHARAAIAAGVTVTIDSDCHRARLLDRQMRFGVGTARRGWVEPRHVLNTRSVDEVRAFIDAKRRWRR